MAKPFHLPPGIGPAENLPCQFPVSSFPQACFISAPALVSLQTSGGAKHRLLRRKSDREIHSSPQGPIMTESTSPTPLSQGKILPPEQIEHFRQKGYLAIGKLLDDDLIGQLRAEYDTVFERARNAGDFRNLALDDSDDLEAKNQAPEQMLQIMQMCERSIHFRRLLYDERILDIVEDLIGTDIQLFHDQALYKPAHCGGPVFWHQDNAYWQCSPATLVSCWLTLDDVDVANGAMHLIPGSHLQALDHERSATTGALLDIGSQIDSTRAVAIDLPAGGLLVHHCQTLHYTPPNKTARQRRAFVIHCMEPGTRRSRNGQNIDVSFANPMLRLRL